MRGKTLHIQQLSRAPFVTYLRYDGHKGFEMGAEIAPVNADTDIKRSNESPKPALLTDV